MIEESLNPDEREVLEAENTLFASRIVVDEISRAIKQRKERGDETTQPVELSGNIDGTKYQVYIPPDEVEEKKI